jgi:hypothetical protein
MTRITSVHTHSTQQPRPSTSGRYRWKWRSEHIQAADQRPAPSTVFPWILFAELGTLRGQLIPAGQQRRPPRQVRPHLPLTVYSCRPFPRWTPAGAGPTWTGARTRRTALTLRCGAASPIGQRLPRPASAGLVILHAAQRLRSCQRDEGKPERVAIGRICWSLPVLRYDLEDEPVPSRRSRRLAAGSAIAPISRATPLWRPAARSGSNAQLLNRTPGGYLLTCP